MLCSRGHRAHQHYNIKSQNGRQIRTLIQIQTIQILLITFLMKQLSHQTREREKKSEQRQSQLEAR